MDAIDTLAMIHSQWEHGYLDGYLNKSRESDSLAYTNGYNCGAMDRDGDRERIYK